MLRPASSRLARRRAREATGSAALISLLALALVAAPMWGALGTECGLCPATCPMHEHRSGAGAGHLGCHRASSTVQHDGVTAGDGRQSIGCAACGNHGSLPSPLPPAILVSPHSQSLALVIARAPRLQCIRHGRLAEPPDTPPPIASA